MFEAILKIEVKNPKEVSKSLKPELDKGENVKIKKKKVEIKIKAKKLTHLKGKINSIISLIKMIEEVEKND
ncbi:MAG: hypothetical protein B6U78_02585 [Candidatus Aenigmarchaeota archaeon ex4484_224]|nr:MAG: hypothetical protein B6U78_02585 [Candidatus Aenigmarchaeota archaeon ex4484_224]